MRNNRPQEKVKRITLKDCLKIIRIVHNGRVLWCPECEFLVKLRKQLRKAVKR